jgi:hypothetical protein
MKPVSPTTEEALRAALARLAAGNAMQTDGRLTVANLAREAEISRATANRAPLILSDLRDMVKTQKQVGPEPPPSPQVHEERNRRAMDNLAAQHVQVRALLRRGEENRKVGLARIHHLRPDE